MGPVMVNNIVRFVNMTIEPPSSGENLKTVWASMDRRRETRRGWYDSCAASTVGRVEVRRELVTSLSGFRVASRMVREDSPK